MVVLNPLLFVIFTFLVELKGNLYETSFFEVGLLVVIFGGAVLAFQIILYLLIRDKYKSSLISSLFVFMFLSFGIFFSYHTTIKIIQNYPFFGFNFGSYKYIFSLYWMLFIALGYGIYRYTFPKFVVDILTKILFILIFINGLFLIPDIYGFLNTENVSISETMKINAITLKYGYKPDIYYIMLDGYPRADTLKFLFNYDNTSFLHFLKDHNFRVLNNSCSNYHHTTASLASLFSMDYESKNLVSRPLVFNILKSQKYKLINIVSNMEFTGSWNFFDEYRGDLLLKTFSRQFLQRTAIVPFIHKINFFKKAYIIKNQFKELENISGEHQNPIFVFCHILLPHLPFAFDENGDSPLEEDDVMLVNLYDEKQIDRYRIQISALNNLLKKAVQVILTKSQKPPIIIIQSDHGSFFLGRSIAYKPLNENLYQLEMKERMSNFSAFYLPYEGKNNLYDTMSNVNTFRIILDHYFGTKFGKLEDKCYWGGGFKEEVDKKGIYKESEINNIPYPSYKVIKNIFELKEFK